MDYKANIYFQLGTVLLLARLKKKQFQLFTISIDKKINQTWENISKKILKEQFFDTFLNRNLKDQYNFSNVVLKIFSD